MKQVIALLAFTFAALAQAPPTLHTTHVQGAVYMISGAGGNVTVQIGKDGILMVDSGLAANADALLAEVRKLSTGPIRYVINTHIHPDHVGGNEKFFLVGSTVAGGNVTGDIGDAAVGAAIIAHEALMNRMSAPGPNDPKYPSKAWPNSTYFTERRKMFFNGEAIEIYHPASAHTDTDSVVFFRRSDVIVMGDNYITTGYPVIDLDHGGSIDGLLKAVNTAIDISVPEDKQEGGTYIIPGHGHISDQADLVQYRDMTTILRDRIRDGVRKGQTLAQVKAAKPTLDYDGVLGTTTGRWTTDAFIEAMYKSLSAKKVEAKK